MCRVSLAQLVDAVRLNQVMMTRTIPCVTSLPDVQAVDKHRIFELRIDPHCPPCRLCDLQEFFQCDNCVLIIVLSIPGFRKSLLDSNRSQLGECKSEWKHKLICAQKWREDVGMSEQHKPTELCSSRRTRFLYKFPVSLIFCPHVCSIHHIVGSDPPHVHHCLGRDLLHLMVVPNRPHQLFCWLILLQQFKVSKRIRIYQVAVVLVFLWTGGKEKGNVLWKFSFMSVLHNVGVVKFVDRPRTHLWAKQSVTLTPSSVMWSVSLQLGKTSVMLEMGER